MPGRFVASTRTRERLSVRDGWLSIHVRTYNSCIKTDEMQISQPNDEGDDCTTATEYDPQGSLDMRLCIQDGNKSGLERLVAWFAFHASQSRIAHVAGRIKDSKSRTNRISRF
ncbi:Uncharacterized protein LW94_6340 [Fusarium fujikuroi]|nr:Uncharacterized protein LW94_6340 [Fusarium fujikuroi]